jgi:hypothetical protein
MQTTICTGDAGVWKAKLAGACLGALALATALLPGTGWAQTATTATTATVTATSAAVVEQQLYGTSQWGTFPIVNSAGATGTAFDDQAAQMTGEFARKSSNNWTFGALQRTSLASIQSAALEVRFAQSGLKDDELVLEYTVDNWATAHRLASFGPGNPAPTGLTTFTFSGLERVISTPARANAVAVRFRGGARAAAADSVTLHMDQVRLTVRGA